MRTPTRDTALQPEPERTPGLTWLRLMGFAAVFEAGLLLVTGVTLGDAETLTFGVVVAATTVWFVRKPSRVPVLVRSLVFVDVLFFMAAATVANATTREGVGSVALPLALAVTSAIGLVATAAYLLGRGAARGRSKGPAAVVGAAAAVSVLVLGVTIAGGDGSQSPMPSDLRLSVHSARFSTTTLTASAGKVTIYASNNDLFWHTVTIDKLGVDVRIPVKGHRRITFTAPAGTYTFYCAIPGHASIGMKGTLTVR